MNPTDTSPKPWGLAAIAGYVVDVESTTEILLSFATLAGGIIAWWGRVKAERPISLTEVAPGLTLKGRP